jgi:DNA-binding GntR family transcriptional regulator
MAVHPARSVPGAADDLALPDLSIDAAGGEALANLVYRELREAICDSRLVPNQRLVQNALADHLGLSRPPVRDALLRLSQEGLVRAMPWRGGFTVSPFTVREVLDIYDVRLPLELLAVREAAGRHTAVQLAGLRELNQRIADGSVDRLLEQYGLNQGFHARVAEPSENDVLKRMLEQLWTMPSSLRMFYVQVADGEPTGHTVREHAAIVDALEAGDGDAAAERLQEHIEGAKRHAVDLLNRQAD